MVSSRVTSKQTDSQRQPAHVIEKGLYWGLPFRHSVLGHRTSMSQGQGPRESRNMKGSITTAPIQHHVSAQQILFEFATD